MNNEERRNNRDINKMDAEKLQDAIGLIKDEFIDDAHELEPETLYGFEPENKHEGSQTGKRNSWANQGAAALGLGKPGDAENAREYYKKNYNSWVNLAQNTERQDKIKKGKGFNSRHLQSITVAAACLILFLSIGIPWAKSHFNMKASVNEEAVESEELDAMAEAEEEAKAEMTASPSAGTEGSGSEFMEDTDPAETHEEYEPAESNGEAFVLTAAEWRDNDNWPFFTNLVSSGLIEFPSYGIDPRNRVKVNVFDEGGNPLAGEEVVLCDEGGNTLWVTKSNKDGIAYLFYDEGQGPTSVISNGEQVDLEVATTTGEDFQGSVEVSLLEDVNITVPKTATDAVETQVMFIVDTTGSMGDELAYLQMDFASIAEEVADGSVWFSTNFYRDEEDEYVTKTNGFTQNLATVQKQFSDEYATGGGDEPEAVADILNETITNNGEWREDCNKVAFLIFDAPPHYGTEDIVLEAVESAATRGIHLVPVVASNAQRDTELFGRALAIVTDGTYIFLTDDSGVGASHLEPIVGAYDVELLHDVIVRIINSYK